MKEKPAPLLIPLLTLLLTVLVTAPHAAAQPPGGEKVETETKAPDGEEGKEKEDEKGPKPYDEVITGEMTSDEGLFTVHTKDDDVYFEIPAAELGKDMVWVTQIAATQAGYSWAGMPVGDRVVRWERRGDRVLLRDVKYDIRADVDDPIARAVEATSVPAIIQAFEVAAYGENEAPVIKVSDFLTADKPEFSASESIDAKGLDDKRSFIEQVKSFPINIETRVLATYKLERPKPGADDGGPRFPSGTRRDPTQSGVTVVLHHSMVKLPEEPMKPRRSDERVGFFDVEFSDYGDDSSHAVERVGYITRWRLEKKDPTAAVSEPVEPIVWYVSREVPAKWQQYVIDGIEAWQGAFEHAGFRRAIIGKPAPTPEEDPDWDPEDSRYTTIRWLSSAVPNAFGPHIHDPRTGEILEADVRMFHNVIKLVRDWYFIQASPSDPRAQKLPMPDEVMGELIAFVVAHEVGHSLGFPHNMKASSSYSIEQLRDAEFTRENGTAPSIMDYARFNYVAQPGDGAGLLPQVGKYDHFAVEWGYSQFPEGTDEKAELEKIVRRQIDDPMLRFGHPDPRQDPTQQTEDLGADTVAATRLGLANLERIAGYLITATSEPGEDYELLENMHNVLIGQWRREMGHVANVVGGVEQINLFYGDAERRFHPLDAATQREAMRFLQEHAFDTPEMLVDTEVTARLEASGVAERLLAAQRSVLGLLLDERRIKRMSEVAASGPVAYEPAAMVGDLTAGLWAELEDRKPAIDLYRRNLQRAHVELLSTALDSSDTASDLPALARGELASLRSTAKSAAGRAADETTRRHLEDMSARAALALSPVRLERPSGDRRGLSPARSPTVRGCWEADD